MPQNIIMYRICVRKILVSEPNVSSLCAMCVISVKEENGFY